MASRATRCLFLPDMFDVSEKRAHNENRAAYDEVQRREVAKYGPPDMQ